MDAPTIAEVLPPNSASVFWIAGGGTGCCPVCGSSAPHDLLSEQVLREARIALSGAARTPLPYLRCPDCGTVHAPDSQSLRYEDEDRDENSLRYYLEEGAGIDLLIEPLARIDRSAIRRYAEIGCSFGFSLDVARLHFDWDVRGVDPSPLAGAGRDALGLPIEQRYFTERNPLGGPPADLLQAAEVIEHITDPHGFMRALVGSLAERGVLVVSTPNAAALEARTPDPMLLQVLQPGMHLTLLTAKALAMLADAHGLGHHRIHETPDDVTLYASRHPFAYDEGARCDRALYLAYLRRRLALAPAGSSLLRGMLFRMARELTLQGRFEEFDALLPDILAEYRERGVDLDDPATNEPRPGAPFNMAGMLYCLGMREVIGRNDRRRGILYFDAAVAWHAGAFAPLSIAGIEDASGGAIAMNAAFQATAARIALDPQGEHDRRAPDPDFGLPSSTHRQRLFAELVNRGDLLRASCHHPHVAAATARGDEEETNKGARAAICFALGIFSLNHLGDRPAARGWLARAVDLASLDPDGESLRYEAAIALRRAADPVDPPAPFVQSDALISGELESPSKPGGAPQDRSHRVTFVSRLLSRMTGSAPRVAETPAEPKPPAISFADLSETPDPSLSPPLDRPDVNDAALTPEQRAWRRDGVLILPKFLPDSVLDPYIARRAALDSPGGWISPVPYLQVPELAAVALHPPLMRMLEHLISEPMLLHLALTGWISTERDWHQDDYLNPSFVNSWYVAVWIALDRIDPAAGPFEYVPGSHRWPLMRGEKVRGFLTEEELNRKEFGVNHWPKYSERFVAPAIEAAIANQRTPPKTFLGEKGDVLIWHGRLMHRGTIATEAGRERRSLIAHYSGVNHRPDMTGRALDANGQNYAVFDVPLH